MVNPASLRPGHLQASVTGRLPGIRGTSDLPPLDGIIGQQRAVSALKFGLGNKSKGYNIYVSGESGTGKLSAVHHFLEILARDGKEPFDWCYVYNFQDPYCPSCLRLPKGRSVSFRNDMSDFITEVRQTLERVFESDDYAQRRDAIFQDIENRRQALFIKVADKAKKEGFTIKQSIVSIVAIPVTDGKELDEEAFSKLDESRKKTINKKRDEIQEELNAMVKQLRELQQEANQKMHELDAEVVSFALAPIVNDLRSRYAGLHQVLDYIENVRDEIQDNLFEFLQLNSNDPAAVAGMTAPDRQVDKYAVNILVDNSGAEGVPLIIEQNPTYTNLFGKVEKESVMGTMYTDFTLIRGGSMHRANGGYLIIPIEDLLRNLFAWDSLKRALKTEQIEIEEPAEKLGFMTSKSLRPQSVPLRVEIILVGEPMIYYLLYHYDKDFRELFKVKADFDVDMEFSDANLELYFQLIAKICREDNLPHFDRSGLERLSAYSTRLAGAQDKLSTRFGEISDMIHEAAHYARERHADLVTGDDVQKAIAEKAYRSNLLKDKIDELIAEGTISIDIVGEKTGQINGLSVLQLGDTSFGRPSRITAVTSVGERGIIDIEREAELGGSIHTKGVLILSGYLADTFGSERPVNLSASIVFEQSYGFVEGDSASSTELYALLSALSGKPLKQGIAVTGSVNQKGRIQAIGGINEKIEGFYFICESHGLTGEQGVIIPATNVKNLALRDEVIDAVRNGKFHIWPVETIDEGIGILTGIPGGRRLEDGTFERESVNDLVDRKLQAYSKKLTALARESNTARTAKKSKK